MKKNRRSGIALVVVIVAIAFMTIVIMEMTVVTRVDAKISANARNRLQARYLAVSAARLQLLRLHMYAEVRNLADSNSNIPLSKSMIDRIWNTPLPIFPLEATIKAAKEVEALAAAAEAAAQGNTPSTANTSTDSTPQSAAQKNAATWPGQFVGSVKSEGSKIPVNMLDGNKYMGSGEEIAEEVQRQLVSLVEGLLQQEEFDELYRGLDPADLINPIIDWVDENEDRIGGGDEARDYERLTPSYKPRNARMSHISELRMVQGWTDDLYRRIADDLSILNSSVEVNPNYISLKRLKAWGPDLTDAELALIQQRRVLSPFSDMAALEQYIQTDPDIRGGNTFEVPEKLKESSTDREKIFLIEGSGIVGETKSNLRLGVVILSLDDEKKKDGDGKETIKKGKLTVPQIVFVEEYL